MAQRNQSKFVTDGTVDDALEQGPGFAMDADDRQFIDNQIRGIQQFLLDNPAEGGSVPTTRIEFVATVASSQLSAFSRIGGCSIDMALYPALLNNKTRTIQFHADVQKTAGATTVEVQLYDATHGVVVTGTNQTSSGTANTRVASGNLTVGSSSGNIRSDVTSQYEVQLRMNGGTPADGVFCTSARLVLTYA